MSEKPYKALGIDLLNSARQDRERAINIFIRLNRGLEEAQLKDPLFGVKAFQRLRAAAVNEQLGRHLPALDVAIAENKQILGETMKAREVAAHCAPPRRGGANKTAARRNRITILLPESRLTPHLFQEMSHASLDPGPDPHDPGARPCLHETHRDLCPCAPAADLKKQNARPIIVRQPLPRIPLGRPMFVSADGH